MVSLSIPEFLKNEVSTSPLEPEEEILSIARHEFEARLGRAADEAFEKGTAHGRELQRKEEVSAFSNLRDSLDADQARARSEAEKLSSAIRDISGELELIETRILETLDAATAAMATKLLLELDSSSELIGKLISTVASDFTPTKIRALVDSDIVESLQDEFSSESSIEIAAGAGGSPLAIEFLTDGGNFEYRLQDAYEQMQRAIAERTGDQL